MPTDIFIAYATPDLAFVQQVQQQLTERGFSTWFDVDNDNTDLAHITQTKQIIQDSKVLLLVTTPDSVNNDKVRGEVKAAHENYGKPFIALQWQAVTALPGAFRALLFRASERIDFAGNNSAAHFEQLVTLLSRYAPPQAPPGPASAAAQPAEGRRLGGLAAKAGTKTGKSPLALGEQVIARIITPLELAPADNDYFSGEIKWLFSALDHLLKVSRGELDRNTAVPEPIPPEVETIPAANNQLLAAANVADLTANLGEGITPLTRLDTQLNRTLAYWLDQEVQAGEQGRGDPYLQSQIKDTRLDIARIVAKELVSLVETAYGVSLSAPQTLVELLENQINPIALGLSIKANIITRLDSLSAENQEFVGEELEWLFNAANGYLISYNLIQRELGREKRRLSQQGVPAAAQKSALEQRLPAIRQQVLNDSRSLPSPIPPEAETGAQANNRLLHMLDDGKLNAYFRITEGGIVVEPEQEFTVRPLLNNLDTRLQGLAVLRQRATKLGADSQSNLALQNTLGHEQREIIAGLQQLARVMQAAYATFVTTPDQLAELLAE
jgi:hypothetical protein